MSFKSRMLQNKRDNADVLRGINLQRLPNGKTCADCAMYNTSCINITQGSAKTCKYKPIKFKEA